MMPPTIVTPNFIQLENTSAIRCAGDSISHQIFIPIRLFLILLHSIHRINMDTRQLLILIVLFIQILASYQRALDQFPPLNLYIGTDGDGFGAGSLPLGAQSPYGAVRLGADTSNTEDIPIVFNHLGGYHYADSHINLFSHTHMFGGGVPDYGEVGIMPVQVTDTKHLQEMISKRNGYRSAFQHAREVAQPGYYQVYLETHKINVELTATEQVGIHRYSYEKNANKQRIILIDSSYTLQSNVCSQSHVKIDDANYEITGSILFKGSLSGRFGGVTTSFAIKLSKWAKFGIWAQGKIVEGQREIDGCSTGAYIILPDDQDQVTMYVGISFISIDQARTNLQMQTNMFESFDTIRTRVQQKWLDELAKFEVSHSRSQENSPFFCPEVRSVLNGIVMLK